MQLLAYLGGTVLATIAVTILFCRYRTARKKRISYGTLLVSPLIANVVVFITLGGLIFGWQFFAPNFWIGNWAMGAALGVVILTTILCILPAILVVVYYQKRRKKDEKRVA
jgi:hypothetical protein